MNTVDYECSELESILYTYIKEIVRKVSLFLSLFPFLYLLTHPKFLYSSFPFPSFFPSSLDSSLYLPLSFPSFLFSFFSPSISSFSLRFSFHCWNRLKRNTMTRSFQQYKHILVLNVLVTSAIGKKKKAKKLNNWEIVNLHENLNSRMTHITFSTNSFEKGFYFNGKLHTVIEIQLNKLQQMMLELKHLSVLVLILCR